MAIKQNMPLVKAWRLFKGLSIEEAASVSALREHDIVQLESSDNPASYLLEKLAVGLGLDIDQVVDL